jgi:4-hydroxy-tetrahydrodipicolinate synthase
VTPYYNKPTQAGLVAHHRAVAEAAPIAQILYNVPGRTACDLLPETTAELARVENIIGLKDATGDLDRVPRLRELCGSDFALYSGDDGSGCEFMLRGGDGVISVTSNVVPALMRGMCEAALDGERETALALNAQLDGLHQALFVESNPIPVKWAMAEMGLSRRGIRLPLTWLSDAQQPTVRQAMQQAGAV